MRSSERSNGRVVEQAELLVRTLTHNSKHSEALLGNRITELLHSALSLGHLRPEREVNLARRERVRVWMLLMLLRVCELRSDAAFHCAKHAARGVADGGGAIVAALRVRGGGEGFEPQFFQLHHCRQRD